MLGEFRARLEEEPLLVVPRMDDIDHHQRELAGESRDAKDNPRHTAQALRDVASSLYPFLRTGTLDVSGGHHDAGDYSKYTINSARLVHDLVFAADVFPRLRA